MLTNLDPVKIIHIVSIPIVLWLEQTSQVITNMGGCIHRLNQRALLGRVH